MDDSAEFFGTRGVVKVRGTIDGDRKDAGDSVQVRLEERIG